VPRVSGRQRLSAGRRQHLVCWLWRSSLNQRSLLTDQCLHVISQWHAGAGKFFLACEKPFLAKFFSMKYKIWTGNPHFGEFRGKIEILRTRSLICRNLQLYVRKLQLPGSAPNFFQPATPLFITGVV